MNALKKQKLFSSLFCTHSLKFVSFSHACPYVCPSATKTSKKNESGGFYWFLPSFVVEGQWQPICLLTVASWTKKGLFSLADVGLQCCLPWRWFSEWQQLATTWSSTCAPQPINKPILRNLQDMPRIDGKATCLGLRVWNMTYFVKTPHRAFMLPSLIPWQRAWSCGFRAKLLSMISWLWWQAWCLGPTLMHVSRVDKEQKMYSSFKPMARWSRHTCLNRTSRPLLATCEPRLGLSQGSSLIARLALIAHVDINPFEIVARICAEYWDHFQI